MSVQLKVCEYYGRFKGAKGWPDTNKPVYIDPRGLKPKWVPYFEEILEPVIDLINFRFNTEFYYAGHKEPDWGNYSEWPDQIVFRFNDNPGSWRLAEAAPIKSDEGYWRAGKVTTFYKVFPKFWRTKKRLQEKMFEATLHEFAHVLGTVHTSIEPATMDTRLTGDDRTGKGFMAWDIAVIQKYLLGYEQGEEASRMDLNMAPSMVTVGGTQWCTLPVVRVGDKSYCVVMKKELLGWKPIFYGRLDKKFFYNSIEYRFEGYARADNVEGYATSFKDDPHWDITMPKLYKDGEITSGTFVKRIIGWDFIEVYP